MALGELIEESRGKTTNERVLDVDPPKVVTSFKMKGNFKGTLCTEIGSYTAVLPCIETRPSETVQVGLGQSDLRHAARKNEALTSLIKYVLNISSMAFIYCKKCGEYRYLTPHAYIRLLTKLGKQQETQPEYRKRIVNIIEYFDGYTLP